jgi:hypothetical protein
VRINVFKLSILFLISPASYAKQIRLYDKRERPTVYEMPDEPKADQDRMISCDSIHPWVVMSEKERTHLLKLVENPKPHQDPNLLP